MCHLIKGKINSQNCRSVLTFIKLFIWVGFVKLNDPFMVILCTFGGHKGMYYSVTTKNAVSSIAHPGLSQVYKRLPHAWIGEIDLTFLAAWGNVHLTPRRQYAWRELIVNQFW